QGWAGLLHGQRRQLIPHLHLSGASRALGNVLLHGGHAFRIQSPRHEIGQQFFHVFALHWTLPEPGLSSAPSDLFVPGREPWSSRKISRSSCKARCTRVFTVPVSQFSSLAISSYLRS